MVKEIQSLAEFEKETKGPGLVVVDFFTTWCGPCKQIAPFIEQLEAKYPEVKFIKVDIEKNEDIAGPRRISSIPTFHFIVKGTLMDEMKGANPATLEQKVMQFKVAVSTFTGSGNKLSADPVDPQVPALSAREARLKAFSAMEGPKKAASAADGKDSPTPSAGTKIDANADDEDEALSMALALSLAEGSGAAAPSVPKFTSSSNSSSSNGGSRSTPVPAPAAAPAVSQQQKQQDEDDYAAAAAELDRQDADIAVQHFQQAPGQEWEEEMVPVPVNEELLAQLLEMGFPEVRARKSLVHGGSLDGAMGWLGEHQDDEDIDQPYMVKKSDTLPRAPLTEEERALRVQAIKDKVKERKSERAKQDKVEEIRKEKERRERGQQIDQTLEERQRLQRKRDAEKMKKEKDVSDQ